MANIALTSTTLSGFLETDFDQLKEVLEDATKDLNTGAIVSAGKITAGADTAASDTATIGYTATEGLIMTGQGSTYDVVIKNDADGNVIQIPTGGTIAQMPSLTASEIIITDASKGLVSAAVATYPSLTELAYVKGVTSAIQTQMDAKGVGDALTTNPLSQFAATTSAQLAGVLSDETGTGLVVFGTSPTLITPALGTPSALVGTNITGTAAGLTVGATTGVEAGADVTDATNVNAAGAVMESDYNATTMMLATSDNTPVASTATQIRTFLNVESGADVTDVTNVTAAGALMDSEVDADLKTFVLPASTTISAFGATLVDDAAATNARTTLGLAIGTDVQAWTAVLDATTASFLTADETKLDGIEALADVTDATNVDAALSGAALTATTLATSDKFLIQDASDSDNLKTVTTQSLIQLIPAELGMAISDETTALTTGTAKLTFRMPYAMTLTDVRATVTTAPTGAVLTVDINETATTILSTKITIDISEKTSTTAAAAPVISDSALADDAEITIDIDTIGSTIAGAGLKIWLIGTRA